MVFSNSVRGTATAITGVLLVALSRAAFAGDAPTVPLKRAPVPSLEAATKQMRERMATLYEQMAACLRSHKSIAECHDEMRNHCKAMMGSQACIRMMGAGGMMGGAAE